MGGTGLGGTGLYNNLTQYYDRTGPIANSSTLGGVYVDTSPYPATDCQDAAIPDGCITGDDIATEPVNNVMPATGWTAAVDHVFYVYLSSGEGNCEGTCFTTDWCQWHSWAQVAPGQPYIIFAAIP